MIDQSNWKEEKLQAECFQWHWNTYPHLRKTLFHVQQKAKNKIEGAKFKAMGVVQGVSDLILVCPGKTVYIELKVEGGRQSKEQIDFQKIIEEYGCQEYYLVRSLEEFQQMVKQLQNL